MTEIENVIYKYKVPIIDGIFNIHMPTPIDPLHFGLQSITTDVGLQEEIPYLWAKVNKLGEIEPVKFFVLGTGHPFPTLEEREYPEYVGTIVGHRGVYVWHLYTVQEWVEWDDIRDDMNGGHE